MTRHVVDALFGLFGGVIPSGLHLAWNFRRNNKDTSGTIDLSLMRKFNK